jgi:hypothetical protein
MGKLLIIGTNSLAAHGPQTSRRPALLEFFDPLLQGREEDE